MAHAVARKQWRQKKEYEILTAILTESGNIVVVTRQVSRLRRAATAGSGPASESENRLVEPRRLGSVVRLRAGDIVAHARPAAVTGFLVGGPAVYPAEVPLPEHDLTFAVDTALHTRLLGSKGVAHRGGVIVPAAPSGCSLRECPPHAHRPGFQGREAALHPGRTAVGEHLQGG